LYPGVNLGFSGINNFAASHATADVLLFLNSDCFFTKPSTLFKALSWVQAPSAGAVGFRLLYPSGEIQHDGMNNDRWNEDPDFVVNLHPGIGKKPGEASRYASQFVSLLTAACLMLKKKVFLEVGGFNRMYLRGDFEDSDLCLKLLVTGYRLGLVQTEDIYHLERQSIAQQEPRARQVITLVNSHLYAQRWEKVIESGLPALELVA
jgi:GT2 family glycosyltransferase